MESPQVRTGPVTLVAHEHILTIATIINFPDALRYARNMDKSLADRFVGMYVNEWTLDYGERGRAAVRRLLDEGHRAGIIPSAVAVEFVE